MRFRLLQVRPGTDEPLLSVLRRWIGTPPTPDGYRDGAIVLIVVRSLVLAFLVPYLMWLDVPYRGWIGLVLGIAILAHMAFAFVVLRTRRELTFSIVQATILVDTLAVGAGLALTGGIDSPVVMIWAPNLAIGAVWVGVRAMFPAVLLVAVEIAALSLNDVGDVAFTPAQIGTLQAFMLAMLVVVGGVVAERQRRTMRALDRAESRARHDPLTGLLNRTAIEERLVEELSRVTRHGLNASALILDLDDFKRLNDLRGHLVGDLALVSVADALMNEKRTSDMAARMGGEEFLLVLPETPQAEAAQIAERLRVRIAATSVASEHLTTSIGVACAPDHGRTAFEVLMAADAALYAAKAAGKNRVVVFDPDTFEPGRQVSADEPGFAAALARRATELAAARDMDPAEVRAVKMAALAEVFNRRPVDDPEVARIVAAAREQLTRELESGSDRSD